MGALGEVALRGMCRDIGAIAIKALLRHQSLRHGLHWPTHGGEIWALSTVTTVLRQHLDTCGAQPTWKRFPYI